MPGIIRTAAVASGTTGVLPILGTDVVAITAVQTAMIISLGKVFDVRLTESAAEYMAITLLTQHAGKLVVGGLSKLIPGIGSAINASVAFTITEMVGWKVASDFSKKIA